MLSACGSDESRPTNHKAEVAQTYAKLRGAVRMAMCSDNPKARGQGITEVAKLSSEMDDDRGNGDGWDVEQEVHELAEALTKDGCR